MSLEPVSLSQLVEGREQAADTVEEPPRHPWILGHRLPRRRRPFFLTERYQRCERCGKRVRLRDR